MADSTVRAVSIWVEAAPGGDLSQNHRDGRSAHSRSASFRLKFGASLLSVGFATFVGCSKQDAPSPDPILIGYLADVSDTAITQARTSLLLAALREINDAGGIVLEDGAHQVDLVVEDHGQSLEITREAIARLKERGAVGAVGPNWSSLVLGTTDPPVDGAAAVAAAEELVLVSGSATAAAITDVDDDGYFFRTAPSDAVQARIAAEHIYDDRGIRSTAIVHRDDAWGNALAATFRENFEALGGTVLSVASYSTEQALEAFDYDPILTTAFEGQPELVYFINFEEFLLIANQVVQGGHLDAYGDAPPAFLVRMASPRKTSLPTCRPRCSST